MTRGVLLALLLAACGSRSELGDPDAEVTSGGGGAATGGGASSSIATTSTGVGAGGFGAACDELTVGLGPVTYDWPDNDFESAMRARFTALESGGVALTAARIPFESPGPVPWGVSQVRLDVWGTDTLGTSLPQRVADVGGRDFVVAPFPSGDQYGLAFDPGFINPDQPMVVVPDLDVLVGSAPLPPGIPVPAGPARPEHLSRWPNGDILFVWEILPNNGNIAYLGAARLEDQVAVAVPLESGCSFFQTEARAVLREDDALFITTSGREAQACFLDDGVIGPANRIQVGILDRESLQLTITEDVFFDQEVQYLEVVERSDGAWALYFTNDLNPMPTPALVAQRIGAAGNLVGEPVAAIPDAYFPPFGVTRWGDGFAVAYFDLFDPGPPTPNLVVRRFDADGELLLEASTPVDFAGPAPVRDLALATSPDGDALLVGFASGMNTNPPSPLRTGLVRFDCVR